MSTTTQRIARALTAIAALSMLSLGAAHAQTAATYPNKPVKVVVGFPAGGGLDVLARIVAQRMSEQTGQQFVVENRPGAGSNIAGDMVAKSAADGYTLLHTNAALMSINPAMYTKMPFSPMKELAPLSQLVRLPLVVTVRNELPIKNLAELRDYARANPGKLNMGSGGNGGSPHLALELFKSQNKLNIVHVPYKGSADALKDMLGGSVDLMIDAISVSAAQVKAGKLRAIAMVSDVRSPAMPDVSTSIEQGFPEYQLMGWQGWVVPTGTPKDIVAKLSSELQKAVRDPATNKRIEEAGYFVVGGSAEEFDALLKRDAVRYAELVRISGAKID
ncbi:MAG: tripartite tricarboxylate transporter substrate binding protein [Burkholderiales bacterium]|nr:MAG: tripartite tricarboxylate transporter substrate binding protein [Betaproteobacteria bacterium]TAG24575.1 MAG: tripartite tricarboxylate transporter substrate binding protein [Burkholderiales bacterium]